MAMHGRVDGPRFAWRGLVAGCGFATTLIRVFTLAAFDGPSLPRSVSLRIVIESDLGCAISVSRVAAVAPEPVVAEEIRRGLGAVGGLPCASA
eukprot:3172857-Pyramimonas_sp.AAC.1